MTWDEVFRTKFGVHVDANEYRVQRQPNKYPDGYKATKHNLKEKVKLLMQEYAHPKSVFSIYLIKWIRPGVSISSLMPKLSPEVQVQGKRVGVKKRKTIKNKKKRNNSSSSFVPPISGERSQLDQVQDKESSNQLERTSSNYVQKILDTTSSKSVQNWKRSQGKSNNETVQTQPGSSGNISNRNLYRGRTDNKLPEFREASGSRGPRLKDYDFNDDDAGSNSSTGSQDSQLDELFKQNVQHDDVKTTFYNKANKHYSNTQLLRLRHEMRTLKENSRKWNKWILSAPITANIIRELLDI